MNAAPQTGSRGSLQQLPPPGRTSGLAWLFLRYDIRLTHTAPFTHEISAEKKKKKDSHKNQSIEYVPFKRKQQPLPGSLQHRSIWTAGTTFTESPSGPGGGRRPAAARDANERVRKQEKCCCCRFSGRIRQQREWTPAAAFVTLLVPWGFSPPTRASSCYH